MSARRGDDDFSNAKRTAKIRRPNPMVLRKSDGAWFEPSFGGAGQAMAALFSERRDENGRRLGNYYFRRIELAPSRWWRPERWQRTGEVWQPDCHTEFDIVKGR